VVDFGLAVSRRWTGQDGSSREETCFVDCRAFGRTAENINKYCRKGRPLFIEGRLTYDTWTAQDGTKRSKHRITVQTFQFIGGAPSGNAGQAGAGTGATATGRDEVHYEPESANTGDDIPF
jgi:single-strand DNA-binding protein